LTSDAGVAGGKEAAMPNGPKTYSELRTIALEAIEWGTKLLKMVGDNPGNEVAPDGPLDELADTHPIDKRRSHNSKVC
jgi:hypothetical protein